MEPRGKKILFGCLGGCGLVVVMLVGSCVGLALWLKSPSQVLDPALLVDPEVTGYAEWTLRLEDPGTTEFVESFIRGIGEINRQANSPLPDGLEQFIDARRTKSMRKDLKRLFPMVVVWTARPAQALDEDEHLLSVSASGMGHQMILVDWVMGFILGRSNEVETLRHDGEKIYVLRRPENSRPSFFIHKGIVFATSDPDNARRTLDRLERPAEAAGTELGALLGALPADSALRGAVINRHGEVRRFVEALDLSGEIEPAVWDDVRGATVVGAIGDQGEFSGAIELYGSGADWARSNAEALGGALVSKLDSSGLEFVTRIDHVGDRVRVEFSRANLFDSIRFPAESGP